MIAGRTTSDSFAAGVRRFLLILGCALSAVWCDAQPTPPQPGPAPAQPAAPAGTDAATQAVAAQEAQRQAGAPPRVDIVEHLVDRTLELFDVRATGNTTAHYVIAMLFLVVAIIIRRIVPGFIFNQLRRIAARTKTTLDDKLFPALETPCSVAIVVIGVFAALRVLKLAPETDLAIGYGSTVAFSLVIYWALLRAFNALLDHAHEIALRRNLSIAAFMPWIKKTLVAVFVVVGTLMVVQSLGYDVRALLAGLGIGGLAFALAAQDTLANVFGSVVVAIDQPFKTGEYVQIGSNDGTVEDIGLRSTKLRRVDKSLIIIPNKTVAAEAITNLSRFTQRRADQVISLTYGTSPDKMEAIVAKIRALIEGEPEVDVSSVLVFFRDFNASSLDIWMAYNSKNPDFVKHMKLRQRLNLAIMRAVQAEGLEFAFPTQTINLDGDIARQMIVGRPSLPPPGDPPRA